MFIGANGIVKCIHAILNENKKREYWMGMKRSKDGSKYILASR